MDTLPLFPRLCEGGARLVQCSGSETRLTSGEIYPSSKDDCVPFGFPRQELKEQQILILENIYLAKLIAKRTKVRGDHSYEDLVHYGVLGLIRAAQRYDSRMNTRFATYATYWIKQSINRAVIDMGRLVKIPSHLAERMPDYFSIYRRLMEKKEGYPPAPEDIAAELGCSTRQVMALMSGLKGHSSLDATLETSPGFVLQDNHCLTEEFNPETALCDKEEHCYLSDFLRELPVKQRYILERRYGLDDQDPQTLDEIGRDIGITKERVRQIQQSTLRKLRKKFQRKLSENKEDSSKGG